jgi:putative solute:sodium symporter small subunit
MATRLAHLRFAGFPLPFYFGAQGAILVYVALIVVYIVLMQFADRPLATRLLLKRRAEP